MEIFIEQLKNNSEKTKDSINSLLIQLKSTAEPLSQANIDEMLNSSSNIIYVARRSDNKEIIGMITLVVYRIPVWKKGWIEDLVVDGNYRGKGIAKKLINKAIERAKKENVLSLNLTSHRTQKIEANKLYKSLGFEKRDTNVYTIKL